MHLPTLLGAALVAALSLPAAAPAQPEPRRETVTVAGAQPIPNIPGKRLVRSQVDDEPARVYRPGEGWFEKPGAHHRVSENASDTRPARLLAVFIVDAGDDRLTIPDHH